jgi:hypothetical protein
VNTSVVETEVVLVSIVPTLILMLVTFIYVSSRQISAHLLLMRAHMSPSSLTFLLDRTLGCLRTQVVRDDRASVLHVQEVRSQRALGRVGINGSLLTLLLLLHRRSQLRRVDDQLLSGMLKVGKEIVLGALGSRLAKQEVSLTDVVGGERSQELKDSSQATDGRIAHAKEAVVIDNALRHDCLGLRNRDSCGHGNSHCLLRNGSDRLGVLRVLLDVLGRNRNRSRLLLLDSCLLGTGHYDFGEDI